MVEASVVFASRWPWSPNSWRVLAVTTKQLAADLARHQTRIHLIMNYRLHCYLWRGQHWGCGCINLYTATHCSTTKLNEILINLNLFFCNAGKHPVSGNSNANDSYVKWIARSVCWKRQWCLWHMFSGRVLKGVFKAVSAAFVHCNFCLMFTCISFQ